MVWQLWTNYGQDLVLDVLWGQTEVMPDTLYLAQITELPTVTSTGATISEPSDDNYERQPIDNSSSGTFWLPAADQAKVNDEGVNWDEADTDWEAVPYYGICDAATDGNLLVFGEHSDPFVITAGQNAYLNPGGLTQYAVGPIQAQEIAE